MKKYSFLIFVFLLFTNHVYAGWVNVNLFVGNRVIQSDDIEDDFQDQTEYGVLTDIDLVLINPALDYLVSSREAKNANGDTINLKITEIDYGLRKSIGIRIINLFLGFGAANYQATEYFKSNDNTTEKITGLRGNGYWLDYGGYVTLGIWNIGLETRHSFGKIAKKNDEYNIDSTHIGFLLGASF